MREQHGACPTQREAPPLSPFCTLLTGGAAAPTRPASGDVHTAAIHPGLRPHNDTASIPAIVVRNKTLFPNSKTICGRAAAGDHSAWWRYRRRTARTGRGLRWKRITGLRLSRNDLLRGLAGTGGGGSDLKAELDRFLGACRSAVPGRHSRPLRRRGAQLPGVEASWRGPITQVNEVCHAAGATAAW